MRRSVAGWLAQRSRDSLVADGLDPDKGQVRAPPLVFANFCQQAWPIIDSAELSWSWHLDELCAVLEDAAHRRHLGEPVKLAIAAPPGSTKSRPVSVMYQAWVWSWWPGSCWIGSSWDEPLAYKFSGLAKILVESPWYQSQWPLKVIGGVSRWSNGYHGVRMAYGVRSRVTGDHAHFIIGDDLLKSQLVEGASPGQIAEAVSISSAFWYSTLGTRAIDHVGARIAVGQLLHIDDPVTVAIRDRGYETLVLPVTNRMGHPWRSPRDHRTVEGEMLCDRIDQAKIDELIINIGPTLAEAQLWQDPKPPGGQLLKAEYFTHRYSLLPADLRRAMETGRWGSGQRWAIYGDLTFKSKRQSRRRKGPDYVVLELWCKVGEDVYLVDQVRGQWGFRESKLQLALFSLRHPVARVVKLEDAANAAAVEDDLTEGGTLQQADLLSALDVAGVEPPKNWVPPTIELLPHGGGTMARTQATEGTWYSGRVKLPMERWIDEPRGFVDEHTRYSGVEGETDDQVSTSSLALLDMKTSTGSAYKQAFSSRNM